MALPQGYKARTLRERKLHGSYGRRTTSSSRARAMEALLREIQRTDKRRASAKKQRETARRNDPMEVLRPFTPKRIDDSVKAATELQYGGQEREIQRNIAASPVQQQRIGDWFGQYQQQLAALRQQSQAQTAQAQTAHTARTEQTATADASQRQELDAQMAADAAKRGATVAPSQESQQAATVRRENADSFAGMISSQGVAHDNFQGELARIGARQLIDERLKETKRERVLRETLKDLMREKGAFGVAKGEELRGVAREDWMNRQKLGLEKRQVAAGEVLAGVKTEAELRKERASRVDARRQERHRRHQRGIDRTREGRLEREGKAREDRLAKGKKRSTFTQSGRRSSAEKFRKGRSILNNVKPSSKRSALLFLTTEGGLDDSMARAVWESYKNKNRGVSKEMAATIRKRYGIGLKIYRPPSKVKKNRYGVPVPRLDK